MLGAWTVAYRDGSIREAAVDSPARSGVSEKKARLVCLLKENTTVMEPRSWNGHDARVESTLFQAWRWSRKV